MPSKCSRFLEITELDADVRVRVPLYEKVFTVDGHCKACDRIHEEHLEAHSRFSLLRAHDRRRRRLLCSARVQRGTAADVVRVFVFRLPAFVAKVDEK